VITIVTSLLAAFTDGYSTYAGAKSPVEHFTRAAAKEFAARGINVNNVAPGPMDTPFFYGQETPERVVFHKSQAMGNRLTDITTSSRWWCSSPATATGSLDKPSSPTAPTPPASSRAAREGACRLRLAW
jgi:NAD(P)-dependent dehydrogenase (short-subunit alcohol dehydrogenase family)